MLIIFFFFFPCFVVVVFIVVWFVMVLLWLLFCFVSLSKHQSWNMKLLKDIDLLQRVQRRDRRMIRFLEHLSCEGRMKEFR